MLPRPGNGSSSTSVRPDEVVKDQDAARLGLEGHGLVEQFVALGLVGKALARRFTSTVEPE